MLKGYFLPDHQGLTKLSAVQDSCQVPCTGQHTRVQCTWSYFLCWQYRQGKPTCNCAPLLLPSATSSGRHSGASESSDFHGPWQSLCQHRQRIDDPVSPCTVDRHDEWTQVVVRLGQRTTQET